jgi:hypothetical protein
MPDGIFSNQKSRSTMGLQWKMLVYRYGYLVDFVAISYILSLFGIFFPFWYFVQRKIWQSKATFMTHI